MLFQVHWFVLIAFRLLIFFNVAYCSGESYVSLTRAQEFSSIHHIIRRSTSQRFHPNENPLSNFEIKRNTIIRTQDSRAMGAEYLNEMQKSSNDDCLMWCLEQPRCNVAVFEEKNNRSCYLFDCGPLSDFRCNFTSYNYYVSSILRNSHPPFDLKQWPSQAQHENELTSLRKPTPAQAEPVAEPKEQPTVVTSPVTPKDAAQPEPRERHHDLEEDHQPGNKWNPDPVCQHYQFQCRSNKECIAIYNVCDGIPQCPDGSDEGKDLQCPQPEEPNKTTMPATPTPTPPPPPAPPSPSTPPTTAPPQPPPPAPQIPEKAPERLVPMYRPNRPDDIPMVDDSGSGSLYGLQDTGKGESAWTQYQQQQQQQQSLANAQQDDYIPPVRETKPSHSLYPPQHTLFANKHSSFHPASAVNYRPNLYQSSISSNNHNHQWNNDYYNNENYDPPPRAPPSEMEYSGSYDSGYRNRNSNYNSNFRMGNLKVGSQVPQPFDHYRPSSPYWAADEQILSKGDIPLVPEMSHQQINPHISRYNSEAMLPQQAYPQQQAQQQQLIAASKAYSIPKKPQYPVPPENNPVYMPHQPPMEGEIKIRRPVVQPQVQNDGSQEDAIYDPQADVPRGSMVDSDVPHAPHRVQQQPVPPVTVNIATSTTTVPPPPPSTTTKKPAHKAPAPHALIHSISHSHVSAVSAETGMTISELQQASRVHSHESNGAVLALTLGLSITAILMVLVACRLRNLRRRLSRRGGRSSLAHDADYLVNGMYL